MLKVHIRIPNKYSVIDLIPISLRTLTTVTMSCYCGFHILSQFDTKQICLIKFALTEQ